MGRINRNPSTFVSMSNNSSPLEKPGNNYNYWIFTSTTLIVTLMVVIATISLWGMDSIHSRAETVVHNQNTKMELVVNMRAAARERTVILQRMTMMSDPFLRDQEYMRFNSQGAAFAKARIAYLNYELSEGEKLLLDKQGNYSKDAVRLQNFVIDLIAADELQQAQYILTDQVIPIQDQVLATLTALHDLNHKIAHQMIDEASQSHHNAKMGMLTTTAVAIMIVIILGVFIMIRSLHINKERGTHLSEISRANNAKSAFLANMSHEIRTPLTAIIGFAEASLDNDQSMNDRVSALRTIVRSGKHLLQVINDILDLSKIEADKLEIEKIDVPLFQLISDIESVARIQVVDKSFAFNVNYEYPIPITISSDPLRLKQVLLNLLSNAFKFTNSGHVNLNISCDRHFNKVTFSVIDSGIGISHEQLQNVFKPFNQEDVSTTRKFGGTGLGLSITKLLVEKLGGEIDVQSTKGVGSNFSVTIYSENLGNAEFVRAADEIPNILYEEQVKDRPGLRKQLTGHILLAEDNLDNQKLIAMHLEKMGAMVHVVDNGKMAVDEALDREYDLIFMDMQMPIMDGVQAVEVLRNRNYKGPVVALTANAMKEDRAKCINAGCDDFVTKPVDRNKLYNVTSRYLDVAEEKQPEAKDSQPIFSSLLAEDKSFYDLVMKFSESLPKQLDTLINAYNQNDLTEVRRIVHDLKGLGGSYGFKQLSEVTSKLMFLLEDNNPGTVPTVLIELEDICKRIYRGLEQQSIDLNKSATG